MNNYSVFKEIIKKIYFKKKKYNIMNQNSLTKDEINKFKEESAEKLNFKIPLEYQNILKITNGFEFNGFQIYSNNLFIKRNLNSSEKEQLIFLGEGNESFLVYNLEKKEYQYLDESMDFLNSFKSLFDLIIFVIKEENIL